MLTICAVARHLCPLTSMRVPHALCILRTWSACVPILLALPSAAVADLQASATISTSSTSAPYSYTVTLNNTGITDIGSFWFAWLDFPDADFLPSAPTVTGMPNGWIAPVTHNGSPGDGYAIEYYNISGSAIAPGASGTFSFTSPDSPLTINGNAYLPSDKVTTSFVYIGFPFTDAGYRFDTTVVSQLSGDANFDGIVNAQDIALVSSNWLSTGGGLIGDVNGDRIVNAQDIALISADWLHASGSDSGSTSAVPEPASWALLLAGAGLLFAFHRGRHDYRAIA